MVALVHDHLTVAGHQIGDLATAHQALDHRHVELSVRRALPASSLADRLQVEAQEEGELRTPLVEQRASVHQDQRAAAALGDQIRPHDGLADAGWRDEDADVVGQKIADRFGLDGRQLAAKGDLQGLSVLPPVLDLEPDSVLTEKCLQIGPAAPRKGDVPLQLLRAPDHPRCQGGREAHALLLVELRVLEGSQPLDLVEHRGGQPGLLDEETLREGRSHSLRERLGDAVEAGPTRGWARPRLGLFVVGWPGTAYTDHRTMPRRFSRDSLDGPLVDRWYGRQVGPLFVTRQGLELIVEEHRVALLAGGVLERQRDEVAEAAPRQRILAWEEPVVGVHAQLVAPGHGLGDQVTAHPPRAHGRNRLREEEPDVGAVPRTRSLHGGRKTNPPASRNEREHIVVPGALVEVHG